MADEKLSVKIAGAHRTGWDHGHLMVYGEGAVDVSDRVAALEARAEKAEWERDEARERVGELMVTAAEQNDYRVARERSPQSERDAALARVRELEAEVNARDEQLAAARSDLNRLAAACDAENPPGPPDLPERVRADAEELAAFRWLVGWLRQNPNRCLGNCRGALGAFTVHAADLILEDGVGATPVELATALDPNWRKAGSKED